MTGSGSPEFDSLRSHLMSNREVRREVEFAFSSLLTAANPYAMSVVADGVKAGCPVNGGGIRFSLVYGLIDEDVIVGQSTYQSGAVIELHLLHLWDLTERTR